MSDELKIKPCPFCGKEMSDKNFFSCDGYPQACGCWETTHTGEEAVNVWNARPLEDALLARAEEAEADSESLRHYVRELQAERDQVKTMVERLITRGCALAIMQNDSARGHWSDLVEEYEEGKK